MDPKESGKCSAIIKDNATGQNRRRKNSASDSQILCYRHQNQIPYFANSAFPPASPDSAETGPPDSAEMGPPDSAEADLTILERFLVSMPLPAPSDFPKMILQTVLNFPPLTPPYSTITGPLTVTSARPSTPSNSAKSDPQSNTSFHSTPYKASQKSASNADLSTRREVFRANIGELTRVEMGCKMKIDSLFEKLDGAADAWWDLKVVTQSLLMSEAWKRWGGERDRTYNPKFPLQPQGLFYKLLQEAQSILTENTTVARLRGFRNIGREDIEFDAPHSLQQSLKS